MYLFFVYLTIKFDIVRSFILVKFKILTGDSVTELQSSFDLCKTISLF
jgi:hypothetical protein